MRGEDFLYEQDRLARKRQARAAAAREWEQKKRDERFAARQAGPTWLDQTAARWQHEARVKQSAKAAARGQQPFNLFWYERVGVVAGGAVLLLVLLSQLPGPLGLLVLIGAVVFAVRADRGRQAAIRMRRTIGAFIRGERLRPPP